MIADSQLQWKPMKQVNKAYCVSSQNCCNRFPQGMAKITGVHASLILKTAHSESGANSDDAEKFKQVPSISLSSEW